MGWKVSISKIEIIIRKTLVVKFILHSLPYLGSEYITTSVPCIGFAKGEWGMLLNTATAKLAAFN